MEQAKNLRQRTAGSEEKRAPQEARFAKGVASAMARIGLLVAYDDVAEQVDFKDARGLPKCPDWGARHHHQPGTMGGWVCPLCPMPRDS